MRPPSRACVHRLLCPPRDSQQAKGRSLLLEPTMWVAQQGEASHHSYATLLTSQDTCLHFLLKCDVGHGQLFRTSGKGLSNPSLLISPSPAQQGHRVTSLRPQPLAGWRGVLPPPHPRCLCRNTCSRIASADVILPYAHGMN